MVAANQDTRSRRADDVSFLSSSAIDLPTEMSEYGPVARPPGFHHVAVLSAATATNAPPMPSARLPTLSTICAEVLVAVMMIRTAAQRNGRIVAAVEKPSSYRRSCQ
jgi:hypothetical protein